MGGCMRPEERLIKCPHCGDIGPAIDMMHHRCMMQSNRMSNFPGKGVQIGGGIKFMTLQQQQMMIQQQIQDQLNQQRKKQKPQNNLSHKKAEVNKQKKDVGKQICQPFLNTQFPPKPDPFEISIYHGQAKYFTNQFIFVKVPVDNSYTRFKWIRQKSIHYPAKLIENLSAEIIRTRTFQEKMFWFRWNVEKIRISWQNGSQVLRIDRGNLINSSLWGLQTVNHRKELKIEFDDEKVADAGGLLRQWMHLIIQEVFKKQTGIFQLCKTDETAYKFVWDKDINFDKVEPYIRLLGIIIGKALFERIPLNCYLNRGIWRRLSGFTVFLHDAYSFDSDLYKNWREVLDNPGSQDLCLEFYQIKTHKNGKTQDVELVQGGKYIQVNDENKVQYVFQLVQLYCFRSVKQYIKVLNEGITSVIPQRLISIFQPYEFQMILNGPQLIDVEDWKENTEYKGYKPTDQVIVWFWQVLMSFDQEKLANLLHYCTGSNRVPVLGFKYLESNRNTTVKFTIQKIKLQKFNPYPKSYTCFNRIELPEYKSFKQLKQKVLVIASKKITSFGLD